MKYLYSLILCFVCANVAYGQKISYEGCQYYISSYSNKTVTFAGGHGVKGNFTVPTSVTFPTTGEVESVRWETVSGPEWTNSDGVYSSTLGEEKGTTVIRCTFKANGPIVFYCANKTGYWDNYLTVGELDKSCTRTSYNESYQSRSWDEDLLLIPLSDNEEHFIEFCFSKEEKNDEEGHAEISLSSLDVNGQYLIENISQNNLFSCNKDLTSVTIPQSFTGFTEIPYSCFQGCSSLRSVSLPRNITTINSQAFYDCSSLVAVDLPNVETIYDNAFSGCTSLKQVEFSFLTRIYGYAFNRCKSLERINLPLVTKIPGGCFMECSSLKELDLSNITHIENHAFSGCTNVQKLRVKNLEQWVGIVFGDDDEGSQFANPLECTYQKVDIFTGNSTAALTDLSNSNIKELPAYAFAHTTITNVSLPEALKISNGAFRGCTSLKNLSIPKVKSIGWGAFGHCREFELDEKGQSTGNDFEIYCSNLERLDLSSVEEIGYEAFYGCEKIKSLRIGSLEQWCNVDFCNSNGNYYNNPLYATNFSVDLYIGDALNPATEISNSNVTRVPDLAFYNLANIKKVSFPAAKTIGNKAFSFCNSLSTVDLPSAISIGSQCFYACISLSNLNVPKLQTIGSSAFSGYWKDNYDEDGNRIDDSYFYCDKLERLELPEVRTIGDYSFYQCQNLKYISIPKVETIGSRAFYDTSLNSVRVSSAEQWCNIEYPTQDNNWDFRYSFPFGCSDENYLYISDSETPATEVTLSANVKKIPYYAFCNTNIHTIHIEGTTPPVLEELNATNEWTMLAVPEEAYETYLAADKYSTIPLQITIDGHITENLANVEAEEKTSVIQKKIGEKYVGKVINLTVSGTINSYDMMIIRNKMTSLRNLDLTNARIVDCDYEYYTGYHSENDVVGPYWFTSTKLMNVKLPKTAKVIGEGLFNNVSTLVNVQIPDGITAIGSYAFSNCNKAEGLRIPEGVTSLGQCAFIDCLKFKDVLIPNSLTNIPYGAFGNINIDNLYLPITLNRLGNDAFGTIENLYIADLSSWMNVDKEYDYWGAPNIKKLFVDGSNTPTEDIIIPEEIREIKQSTFSGFTGLKSVILPDSLEAIGRSAFCGTNISKITLPEKIKRIEDNSFYQCPSLSTIEFNDSLKAIGYEAFGYCNALKKVELSPFLKTIGERAFYGCGNLEEVLIPAGIEVINDYAFDNCPKLSKVIATTVEPISIIQETFGAVYKTANVYAPKTSYDNYYWDTQWSQFLSVEEYDKYYGDSYKYKYFYLKGDFKLDKEKGRIHGCPKADFHERCGLIVTGDEIQELDSICLKHTGHDGASVIGNGNIHAKKVVVEIDVKGNKWHFFYFPVDIDMRDVKYRGSSVWYYYDGEARAENGNGGWKKVTGGKLEAGRGYIFQGSKDGKLYVGLREHTFRGENKRMPLHAHVAKKKNDASWNLIGNPFVSYFGVDALEYNAPITIYNNETGNYETIRRGDDHYDFHPFQAFFVQKPDAQNTMDFDALHRMTKTQTDKKNAKRLAAMKDEVVADSLRKIINLSVVQGDLSDRTRVVVNPDRSVSYEMDCDAAKFIADNMPQIYTVDNEGANYSINERCIGNGLVNVVVTSPKEDICTISASRLDCKVLLRDMETGVEVDLSEEDYSFLAEATTYTNRFVLVLSDEATEIDMVESVGANVCVEDGSIVISGTEKDVKVFNLSGALVASHKGSGCIDVANGPYIVKIGGKSTKVVVNN